MPIPTPSTPGKGYVLGGVPYVFTDTKGTAVPAMRDPQTNAWVPNQRAMAQGGMKQAGSAVASPEDDAFLKELTAKVGPARELSDYAQRFEDLRTKLNARGQHTGPQWLPAPVTGKSGTATVRRSLAGSDPESEGLLEQMEGLSGTMWPLLRPEKSGTIRTSESGSGNTDAVVSMPDPGWKTAVPNIGAVDPANAGMATGYRDKYVDASNRADFIQNYVHSGKGTASAAGAVYDNMKVTPSARAEILAGKHQTLGANPADFSGKPVGWQSKMPAKQQAAAHLYTDAAQYIPGHAKNPFFPTSQAEVDRINQLAPGSYYVNTNGVRLQMPGKPRPGQDYVGIP
jgi:hypothetical protein